MGRYSFSPPGRESVEVSATAWREYKDDYISSSDSDDISESSIDSSDDEEEEYPHPLGFPSFGKTRFFLDPPTESAQKVRRRLGLLKDPNDDFLAAEENDWETQPIMQSFPPLSSYTDAKTASTEALLSYSYYNDVRPEEEDALLDGVTQLLQAARIVEDDSPQYARLCSETQQAGQQLLAMSKNMERELASARQDVSLKRQELEREHQETHAAFLLLLKRDQQAADKVLKQQEAEAKAEAKAQEEAAQLKRDQQEQDEAERQRIADERQKKEQEKQQRALKAAQQRDQDQKAAAEEEAKKTEYITKAKKRVAQLVDLRASVAPFEKSKNVSRRRLKMKKTVKGKVNTLSQDAQKIQSVATEVAQAIQEAKDEDEQLKQQIRAGNRDITEEMIRGKRYLVDLLASDTMVRAQAEGFNGTRGDGFPLASMLALISTQAKELLPILAAHIYTVCPTAIPALPKVTKNESETELMESLGMTKGKDGQYETFDRFLSRTEGIISLVADIMASNPPEHSLMGGHKGAIEWLERFLGQLPEAPETMPLLTAPVLDAFLTGAGHMLANKFPEEFRKHLDVVMNDVLNRLDEGTIGAPSALRLKKVVKGGFDSFKIDLPPKAIHSLYNAGASSGSASSSFEQSATATTQPSSGSSMSTPVSNPFGGGQQQQQQQTPSNPFGGGQQQQQQQASSNPFGGGQQQQQQQASSNPFGGQQQQASSGPFISGGSDTSSTSNPFGAPSSSNVAAAGSTSFGSSAPGFAPATAVPAPQTPFGAPGPATPFGQPASSMSQQTASGFGGGQSSGFGGGASTAMGGMNASPFGQPSGSAGFGGVGASTASGSMNASPFGQPSMQTSSNASPFGLQTSGGTNAFGSQNQPTSMQSGFGFGGGASSNASGASPFGNQSQSTMNAAKSPFGNVSNPFVAPVTQSNTGTAFGASTNATPFGGNQNSSFGVSTNQSTPFSQQNASFGGGFGGGGGGGNRNTSNKPPCKFFAQGKCRFGDQCRFSHDTGNTGGGGGGAFSNNPFGGPRR